MCFHFCAFHFSILVFIHQSHLMSDFHFNMLYILSKGPWYGTILERCYEQVT